MNDDEHVISKRLLEESSLGHFVGVGDLELDDLGRKIHQVYGLDVSDVAGGNLLQIFVGIATIDPGEADD